MNAPVPRTFFWALGLLALLHTAPLRAQDPQDLPPSEPAAAPETPLEQPAAPPAPLLPSPAPVEPPDPALLSPLGPGTGPGLPWPVVLALQLMSYAAMDVVPFFTCLVCSCGVSALVPLGPGLPLAVAMSVLLIPPAAMLSGCLSASVLQFVGDRLGTQRGRLACVGLTSMGMSLITYALVIAPIIIGMGFLGVALVSFLSTSALLVVPQVRPPGPEWLYGAVGYSLTALGGLSAVVMLLLGTILAPATGFILRPALVALIYRGTGRPRAPGEEQWPPTMFGERADQWWPFGRGRKPAATPPAQPPSTPPIPAAPPPPAQPSAQPGTPPSTGGSAATPGGTSAALRY